LLEWVNQVDIIKRLRKLGHLSEPGILTLDNSVVKRAIESYRYIMGAPDDMSVEDLFAIPRCGENDFEVNNGSGSWRVGCLPTYPNNHAVVYRVNKAGLPSYLASSFEDSWEMMASAYARIGLAIVRNDSSSNYNSLVTFQRGSGWIGLAIVGRGQTCSTKMWAKFDNRYGSSFNPNTLKHMWARLLAHELGHNCGLGHSRGGVMNPSIVSGEFKETEWVNDPSFSILKRWFGGEPIKPVDQSPIWTIPQPENPQ
jgi:hypothetical protein